MIRDRGEPLHRYAVRHPGRVLLLAVLATTAVVPGLLRLQLRTDGAALVSHGHPAVRADREVRREFGVDDDVVVLIVARHPDGVFNEHTLRLVRDLTADLQALPSVGPARVTSLATERGHRVARGSLEFRTFLDPLPRGREELDRLKADLRSLRLYTGTLVAFDETATAILVGVPGDRSRIELLRRIGDVVARRETSHEETFVIGAPVAESLLGRHILHDLGLPASQVGPGAARTDEAGSLAANGPGLLPLSLLMLSLVFLAAFRSAAAVVLPLTEVGACLAFVFGLMGLLGIPVYLTTSILPVILTMVGVADEVHVFSRYAQLRREHAERAIPDVVRQTMDEMKGPIVKTSVTTGAGFLSFAASPIVPVRAFGLFAAAGILFCMVWSLTVIPSLLVILKPRVPSGRGRPRERAASFGRRVTRHRRVVLGAALLAAVLLPAGILRVTVQDSWIRGFSRESTFSRATRFFDEHFFGTHELRIRLTATAPHPSGEAQVRSLQPFRVAVPRRGMPDPADLVGSALRLEPVGSARDGADEPAWSSVILAAETSGDDIVLTTWRGDGWPRFALLAETDERLAFEVLPEPLARPPVLRRVESLERFLRESPLPTVGGVLGPVDFLKTTRFIAFDRREDSRTVPDRSREVRLLWDDYDRIRGDGKLREIVSADYRSGLVSAYLRDANFVDTARLLDALRAWERESLAPHGIFLTVAGDVAVSQSLIEGIVATQVGSLSISLVGIFLVVALLDRSIRWAAYCVLPSAFAVATVFATMGWVGMPLGVATSVFAGMTLGIGVDFAIHLTDRYRRATNAGAAPASALGESLRVAGPAILIDGLAVGLAFSVLGISQVPANARLGVVALVTVATCLAATFLILPALLSALPPRAAAPKRVVRARP